MLSLESEGAVTPSDGLEDVTELVFKALDHLNDCEFLAKPDFDLNETMSAFEAMDPKMDMRLKRLEAPHPVKKIQDGTLIVDRPLSREELVALMDEFFI